MREMFGFFDNPATAAAGTERAAPFRTFSYLWRIEPPEASILFKNPGTSALLEKTTITVTGGLVAEAGERAGNKERGCETNGYAQQKPRVFHRGQLSNRFTEEAYVRSRPSSCCKLPESLSRSNLDSPQGRFGERGFFPHRSIPGRDQNSPSR